MSRLWITAFLASALLVALSFYPTIRDFKKARPDQFFLGTHNNLLDYPMFVAVINRAQRGKWCNKAVFTSENQPCDLVHWIYIPLGKLTQLLNNFTNYFLRITLIPPSQLAIYTYQIGRIIFGMTLSLSTFYFISTLFSQAAEKKPTTKNKQRPWMPFFKKFTQPAGKNLTGVTDLMVAGEYIGSAQADSPPSSKTRTTTGSEKIGIKASSAQLLVLGAFLLALFSAGFPRLSSIYGKLVPTGTYLEWWTGGDILRRATFQPHAMLKNTLLLLILTSFTKLFSQAPSKDQSPNKKHNLLRINNFILPTAGLLLGLHDPMNTLSIFLLLALYTFFQLVKHRFKLNFLTRHPFPSLYLYLTLASLGLAATLLTFKYTPWKSVSDWEATSSYPITLWEYGNHLGPIFYLGIPGLILLATSTLTKKKANSQESAPLTNRFLVWSAVVLTFSTFFFILSGISKLLSLSALRFFQTPVHIFLSIGAAYLVYLISHLFSRGLKTWSLKLKASSFIFWFILLVTLSITLPSYSLSYQRQFKDWKTSDWNIYVDRNSFDTILQLKAISDPDDVVLSNDLVGQVVPTVAGNIVYVGHPISTLNFPSKVELTKKFFTGQMEKTEAISFIRSSRAKFLITFYLEKKSVNPQIYPFLVPIALGQNVQIYKIDPDLSIDTSSVKL